MTTRSMIIQFDGGRESWRTSARYDENGFWTFILCFRLHGTYIERTPKGPAFLVKNDLLTRQRVPVSAMLATTTT